MSSLFGLLLEPLDGGVFKFGGSKYDSSSIGSTQLSGNSCKKENPIYLKITFEFDLIHTRLKVRDLRSNHLYCHHQ